MREEAKLRHSAELLNPVARTARRRSAVRFNAVAGTARRRSADRVAPSAGTARRRSAELYSAVSQIFNLRTGRCESIGGRYQDRPQREFVEGFDRAKTLGCPAECNSAIQQIKNLRYGACAMGPLPGNQPYVLPGSEAVDCATHGSRQALLQRQCSGKSQSFALTGLFTT